MGNKGHYQWISAAFFSALLPLEGADVCKLRVDSCLDRFIGDTIAIPPYVTGFHESFAVCDTPFSAYSPAGPVSVMLLVENSTAMGRIDPDGDRFKLGARLLNMLKQESPESEAGMVVFSNRLSFDHRDNPFFQSAFPGNLNEHDSYVPLTKLNHEFPNGRKGIDSLLTLLQNSPGGDLVHGTKLPSARNNAVYPKSTIRGGCDLTLALKAAKAAIKTAASANRDRFILLITQGIAEGMDTERIPMGDDFYKESYSDAATPTTFTFYIPGDAMQLGNLVMLTDNTRWNEYSTSNPLSNFWKAGLMADDSHYDIFKSLMFRRKIGNPPSEARMLELVISGGGRVSGSVSSKSAMFHDMSKLGWKDFMRLRFTTDFKSSAGNEMNLSGIVCLKKTENPASLPAGMSLVCRPDPVSILPKTFANRKSRFPGYHLEGRTAQHDATGRSVNSSVHPFKTR